MKKFIETGLKLQPRISFLPFLAVFVVYTLVGRLGIELATISQSASPVWPATGIAISAALLYSRSILFAIFFGAFFVNTLIGTPFLVNVAIASGNTAEAFVGAYLITYFMRFQERLDFQKETISITIASVTAASVSASVGVIALILGGQASWVAAPEIWLTWWVGDCLGALVVLPFFVEFWNQSASQKLHEFFSLKRINIFVSAALIVGTSYIVFLTDYGNEWLFLVLFALLICVILTNSFFTKIFIIILYTLAVSCTVFGTGPFQGAELNQNIIYLQLFLGVVSVTGLVILGLKERGLLKQTIIILVFGWLITNYLYYSFVQKENARDQTRFYSMVKVAENQIASEFQYYEDVLHSAAGLLAVKKKLTVADWHRFVEARDFWVRYPGVNALEIVWRVRKRALKKFVNRMQVIGVNDFKVKSWDGSKIDLASMGKREHLYVVSLIEPIEGNKKVRGLDLASEGIRKKAADYAALTGKPILSDTVSLVQDLQSRPGALLMYPFYEGGKTPKSEEKRKEKIRGWIVAPFVYDSFFKKVSFQFSKEIKFNLYDRRTLKKASLLYDGTKGRKHSSFEYSTALNLAQKQVFIGWSRGAGFISSKDATAAWVWACGAIVTLLIAVMMSTLQSISERAYRLAGQQTKKLRLREKELLKANNEVKKTTAAKTEFLANMSHEIRTPINGILGLTELLQNTEPTEKQREFLDTLERSVQSLLVIINDILDLSKIESSKFNLEETSFDLSEILRDVERTVGFQVEKKGLNFLLEIQSKLYPSYDGDPMRLRQVLGNLLSNAIKFTSSGKIVLRVKQESKKDNEVVLFFEIEDSGVGIPEAQKGKLFQKFTQADSSTARKYGGTGLGLVICKGIVEKMGGKIHFESCEGKGTKFSFYVVLTGNQTPAEYRSSTPQKTSDIKISKGAHILLAEDNAVNQMVTSKILEKVGYIVQVAESGKEALELLGNKHFDLVLMDCQMPEMDGYRATLEIRSGKIPECKKMPIIAMTANAFSGDKKKCIEVGMNDYVSKPVKTEDLVSKIEAHLAANFLGFEKENATKNGAQVFEAEKSFDPTSLEELAKIFAGDDRADFHKIIDTYFKSMPFRFEQLIECVESEKFIEAQKIAHGMKSSSAQIGGVRLAQNLHTLEHLDKKTKKAGFKEVLSKSMSEYKALKKAVEDFVKKLT